LPLLASIRDIAKNLQPTEATLVEKLQSTYTHDARSRNRRHKSTPFSGTSFVPCATGMKISGAEISMAEIDVISDEFLIYDQITTRKHIKT